MQSMRDAVKREAINMMIASEEKEKELQPVANSSQRREFILKNSDIHKKMCRTETASQHPEVAMASRHSGAHVMFHLYSLTRG